MSRLPYYLILCLPLLLLGACDVHEWPELPERVPFILKLNYEKEMTLWKHLHDGTNVIEQGLGETYDNGREEGKIRYIIRAYPVVEKQRTTREYAQEFVFTKDISEGYDHEVMLDLSPGDYSIMVWSDLTESGDRSPYYNADEFGGITLQGDHEGNNDYRDAFRGTGDISLAADVMERTPGMLEITMQRPLAKFEVITDDLAEFIGKQTTRMSAGNDESQPIPEESSETKARIEDYRVVFYYVGFMPDTYGMFTDKPVDSATGVTFQSVLRQVNDTQATLGFDYVFVNGKESAITVRIGLYDTEGTQLSLTDPIEIPLRRNHHTVLRGKFLMSETSGGVTINPDFDGEYNLIFP